MSTPKVITQVAAHDAANRKAFDEAREEAELQERIAKTTKPAPAVESTSPVMATPAVAQSFAESAPEPENPPAPVVKPAVMPDGTVIKPLSEEDKLRMALRNLVNKLDEMAEDESFKQVWKTALAAGVVYEGPIWKPELDWAKTLLK